MGRYRKFYSREQKLYPEAHALHLNEAYTMLAARKLVRHFKISVMPEVILRGTMKTRGGRASPRRIRLPRDTSLLLLCHEVAHVYELQKTRKSRHDKGLMYLIGRMVKYCYRRKLWEREATPLMGAWAPPQSLLGGR